MKTLASDEIFSPCNKTVLRGLIITPTLRRIISTETVKK